VKRPRRWSALAVAAGLGGLALFVWSIRLAGAQAVIGGFRRLGVGFVAILVLGGIRHLLRAQAWRLSIEPPDRIGLGAAFGAYLAGDSLGNITPFGFLISEPSKIVLSKDKLRPTISIAALAIENLFYGGGVVIMLLAGTAALLLSFPVTGGLREVSVAMLIGTVVAAVAAIWIVATRRPVTSRFVDGLIRRNIARSLLEPLSVHVLEFERRIYGFARRQPRRVLPIVGLELGYHATAVLEIWIALPLILGRSPGLLNAFVLEYTNRTITILFQFVPMWIGVDEAGTGLVAAALGLNPAAGVTLALARKARITVWTALGLGVLLHRGLSPRAAAEEAEELRPGEI
jgi:hypothetical protein